MAKRDTLSFLPDFQEYVVAAIHCTSEPHQLAWQLNNHCDTQFWRNSEDLTIQDSSGESVYIWYRYLIPDTGEIYYLLTNTGYNGFLVQSKPRPDYLLVSNGENAEITIQAWLNELKKNNLIHMTHIISPSLKSKLYWLASLQNEENY